MTINDHRGTSGYYYEAKTHTAVAAAIAQGRADAGIGVRAAAHMYGLDFIALGWERYDFLVQKARIGKEAVKAFLEILRSSEFAEILSSIPGYIVPKDIGEIIFPAL
jgi:putative molybdopterin biosynthesis protein